MHSPSQPILMLAAFAFATFLCVLLSATLLVAFVGFICAEPVTPFALYLAAVPSWFFTYRYLFRGIPKLQGWGLLGCMALYLAGRAVSGIWDFSYDGMFYHQPAVDALLEGHNPYRETADLIFLNIYVHGVWVLEAAAASLFGDIEAAMGLSLFWLAIMAPVLIAGVWSMQCRLGKMQWCLLALLVLNPVLITQMLTHYVDGLLYAAGMTFIGALLLFVHHEAYRKPAWALMLASLFLLVNTKLSGIYYGGMLCVGATCYLWRYEEKRPFTLIAALAVTGLFSVLIVGNKPYVVNMVHYGWLLPFSGEQLVQGLRPANMDAMHPLVRLFYSVFSISGGANGAEAVLKWPWTIHPREWQAGHVDNRSGGFGPLFGLGVLLVLVAVLVRMCASFRNRQGHSAYPNKRILLWLALLLFVFGICFPQSWWARYSPFLYAVPLLLALWLSSPDIAKQRQKWLLWVVISVFAMNAAVVVYAVQYVRIETWHNHMHLVQQLKSLKGARPYLVPEGGAFYTQYNHAYITLQRRFDPHGIMFYVWIDGPCERQITELVGYKLCY